MWKPKIVSFLKALIMWILVKGPLKVWKLAGNYVETLKKKDQHRYEEIVGKELDKNIEENVKLDEHSRELEMTIREKDKAITALKCENNGLKYQLKVCELAKKEVEQHIDFLLSERQRSYKNLADFVPGYTGEMIPMSYASDDDKLYLNKHTRDKLNNF